MGAERERNIYQDGPLGQRVTSAELKTTLQDIGKFDLMQAAENQPIFCTLAIPHQNQSERREQLLATQIPVLKGAYESFKAAMEAAGFRETSSTQSRDEQLRKMGVLKASAAQGDFRRLSTISVDTAPTDSISFPGVTAEQYQGERVLGWGSFIVLSEDSAQKLQLLTLVNLRTEMFQTLTGLLEATRLKLLDRQLRDFFKLHFVSHKKVRVLTEETMAQIQASAQTLSRPASQEWVYEVARKVLLDKAGDKQFQTPSEEFEKAKKEYSTYLPAESLELIELAVKGLNIDQIATHFDQPRNWVKRSMVSIRKRVEKRSFLPHGLKRATSYKDSRLTHAARHNLLPAIKFLRIRYTTDEAVINYLPKQEPRAITKVGYLLISKLPAYEYFLLINRYPNLLTRESNRVLISEQDWQSIRAQLPPRQAIDLIIRFATNQYEYRKLLVAAKSGELEATYDSSRKAWITSGEAVERFKSSTTLNLLNHS